jgi:hypothetical protein
MPSVPTATAPQAAGSDRRHQASAASATLDQPKDLVLKGPESRAGAASTTRAARGLAQETEVLALDQAVPQPGADGVASQRGGYHPLQGTYPDASGSDERILGTSGSTGSRALIVASLRFQPCGYCA